MSQKLHIKLRTLTRGKTFSEVNVDYSKFWMRYNLESMKNFEFQHGFKEDLKTEWINALISKDILCTPKCPKVWTSRS